MHGYFSAEKFLVLAPSRSQGILKLLSAFLLDNAGFFEGGVSAVFADGFPAAG